MQLARTLAVTLVLLAAARRAHADAASPPPAPPQPYLLVLGLGLGALSLDQTKAGCPACSETPPAVDTFVAAGAKLTPELAVGAQLGAQVEFVNGHDGDSARLDTIGVFVFGQAAVTPLLQLTGGLGYATAQYQYSVQSDGVFGTTTQDETDHIASGAALLVAGGLRLGRIGWSEVGVEVRATTIFLGAAGTAVGFSVDIVGGRF